MSASVSIFTRIIRGEIPCHRVHEDALTFAFLDIAPLAPGHTLVIPRREVALLHELTADEAAALARTAALLAPRILAAVGATAYNLLQNNGSAAGQVVPHVHVHIIPRREGDGLGYRWNARSAAPEELAALATKIRA
ncbi:MAG: HIT domain-containing protein [Planctomycetia bacterium]|nr:MAG: HIT domain-containing protein [Planctomycetia bacterium]